MEMPTAMSPVLKARVAGGFYLVTVIGSIYSFVIAAGTGGGHAAGLVAGTANLMVTLLLFDLLKPVNGLIALLAVFFNIEGSAHEHDPLAFFGCFCLCTGYLIYRSTFMPRLLGVAMVLAGVGLLTNAYAPLLMPSFAHRLSPIGFILDGIGELSLTLWLIVIGVNGQRWREVKALAERRTSAR